MSEDNLKELWEEFNQPAENTPAYSEEQIRDMLEGKANDIFTRISRNLKIGMILLGLYLCMTIWGIYEIYFSDNPYFIDLNLSKWYISIDLFADFLIIASFVYFVISFKRLNINAISGDKIVGTVKSAIKILKTYRKFFYYVVGVVTVGGIFGFIVGARHGIELAKKMQENELATNPSGEFVMIAMIVVSGIVFFSIFFFLVWYVFKKLYGDYIEKLEECYDELIESE